MKIGMGQLRSLKLLLGAVAIAPVFLGNPCWAQMQSEGSSDPFKLTTALAKRKFLRVGYTYVKPHFKSHEAVDETGPVIRYGDESTPGLNNGTPAAQGAVSALTFLSHGLKTDHPDDFQSQGLFTPRGTTIDVGNGGTPTLTVGMFLDEEHTWSVESFVLGIPISTKGRGTGRIGTPAPAGSINGESMDLGEVMTSKQFGPIVVARRVFGSKGDRFRPSVGFGVAYTIFMDAKASQSLTQAVGGPSKIKIDNAFGAGPFLGFEYKLGADDRWSIFGSFGYLKMKTTATISTQTDPAILGRSMGAFLSARDAGPTTLTAVQIVTGTMVGGAEALNGSNNLLPSVLSELARARTGDANNLGVYKRRIDADVNPYVITMGIGYAF